MHKYTCTACAVPEIDTKFIVKLEPMHALLYVNPNVSSLQVVWYEDQAMVRVKLGPLVCVLHLPAHANSRQVMLSLQT